MKLLLLGGTADGRKLASALHQQHVEVIYSIAGLVRMPQLDCMVISGGFSQLGGLQSYIEQQKITAILDVTHPYAQQMSINAALAAKACAIPYWRFHRPQWQALIAGNVAENVAGNVVDNWQFFEHLTQLPQLLSAYQHVFFTLGQLDAGLIASLEPCLTPGFQRHLVRTAAPSKATLSDSMHWLKGIGPFSVDDEIALMKQHQIDVLVTKNSGGSSTYAKLEAARLLKIPVLMQTRPQLPSADTLFIEPSAVLQHIKKIIDHE